MSINNLLAQQATIYNKSGYNKFGRDTETSGTIVRCRFQNKSKTKVMPNQEVVQLVGIFYFAGGTTVAAEDRVIYNGVSYKVFGINGSIDGRGTERLVRADVTKWQT